MEELRQMALQSTKEASVQDTATGVPGHDTHIASVGDKHDKVDKNKVTPLSLPQHYEQKASTDANAPVKKASSVEQLGTELLAVINKAAESAPVATEKDMNPTNAVSTPDAPVAKNEVKPEALKQEVKQEVSSDANAPTKTSPAASSEPKKEETKTAAEQEKIAAYRALGQELAAGLLQSLSGQQEKSAADKQAAVEKEAGRRDFEMIVTAAADELFKEKIASEIAGVEQKYAAELGKVAADLTIKEAQIAALTEENTKYASWFDKLNKEIMQKEAEEKELQKQAAFEAFIERTLKTKLAEALATPAPVAK